MQYARVVMALAGVLTLFVTVVVAEDTQQLAPGARVRVEVSTAEERLVGRLLALDDKHLNLQVEDEKEPRSLPREDVEALAVSTGGRSRAMGAVIGGSIGVFAGAVIGYAGGDDPDPDAWIVFERQDTALAGAVLLGSLGALIGLATSGERWEDVPLDNVRLSVGPVPGRGAGVFLTVGF